MPKGISETPSPLRPFSSEVDRCGEFLVASVASAPPVSSCRLCRRPDAEGVEPGQERACHVRRPPNRMPVISALWREWQR
jgi:hypothetical protein